jgi:predicted deacetylase
MPPDQVLAVAVHDIEPATFERAALIRDWLTDLGVDRATLLVIPARDMHPLSDRRPEVGPWLVERACRGDAVAQHGFCHLQSHPGRFPRHPLAAIGSEAPEFIGLDSSATARAVDAGRRVLKLAGVEPHGFVAPAYAYTPHLRESLRTRFQWWAGTWALHPTCAGGRRCVSGPPIGLTARGPVTRLLSPAILRVVSRLAGPTLRLDVHPLDLRSPSHMLALEDVIRRARRRRACVTYDDLVASNGAR